MAWVDTQRWKNKLYLLNGEKTSFVGNKVECRRAVKRKLRKPQQSDCDWLSYWKASPSHNQEDTEDPLGIVDVGKWANFIGSKMEILFGGAGSEERRIFCRVCIALFWIVYLLINIQLWSRNLGTSSDDLILFTELISELCWCVCVLTSSDKALLIGCCGGWR